MTVSLLEVITAIIILDLHGSVVPESLFKQVEQLSPEERVGRILLYYLLFGTLKDGLLIGLHHSLGEIKSIVTALRLKERGIDRHILLV